MFLIKSTLASAVANQVIVNGDVILKEEVPKSVTLLNPTVDLKKEEEIQKQTQCRNKEINI